MFHIRNRVEVTRVTNCNWSYQKTRKMTRCTGLNRHWLNRLGRTTKPVNGTIVNRGEWLWVPANFKGSDKEVYLDVEQAFHVTLTVHNLLFYPQMIWLSDCTLACHWLKCWYMLNIFCLCTVTAEKYEQKHRTMRFAKLHNHSPRLSMMDTKGSLFRSKFLQNFIELNHHTFTITTNCTLLQHRETFSTQSRSLEDSNTSRASDRQIPIVYCGVQNSRLRAIK